MTTEQRLGRALLIAAIVLGVQSARASTSGGGCGDFLAVLGHKPAALEYVGCAAGYDAQLRVLVASYEVKGSRAKRVERYLSRYTGMGQLRFLCCGWEPASVATGGLQRRDGRLPRGLEPSDRVTMFSDETLVSRRADWAQIPAFHVRVTRYLESP